MRIWLLTLTIAWACSSVAQEKLLEIGDSYYELGQYKPAFDAYQQAAETYYTKADYTTYMQLGGKMARCHLASGLFNSAEQLINRSLQFAEIQKITQNFQAELFQIKAEILLKTGRNDQAIILLRQAEIALSEQQDLKLASCYNDLGVAYWNNGNKEIAQGFHERALSLRRDLLPANDPLLADSYLNLGLIYLNESDLQAILYFNKALAIYQNTYGAASPKVALCYSNLAFASSNQGNYDEAIRYLEMNMDIWNARFEGDHPNKAFTISNKGIIKARQNQTNQAIDLQQEALQMYLRLYGNKHPEVANTYYLLGQIYQDKQEYRKAATLFQESIFANFTNQQFEDLYELPELNDFFNADILLSSLQSKALALEALHFEKTVRPRDIKAALQTYQLCDELITQIRYLRLNESDKLKLGKIAADVYENGIRIAVYLSQKTLQRKTYFNEAFKMCEASKAAVLQDAIADTKAQQYAGLPDQELVLEDSLKTQISTLRQQLADRSLSVDIAQIKSDLFSMEQAYQNFIQYLETTYPAYYQLKYNTTQLEVTEIQTSLAQNSAILSYFIGSNTLYRFLITPEEVQVSTSKVAPEHMRWLRAYRNAMKYRVGEVYETSALKLADWLIPNLPGSIQNLIIIPDGALSSIPFEALLRNQKKQQTFLIEDFGISYNFSASLWKNQMLSDQGTEKDMLLMAPISFSESSGNLSDLPGTESEVREIKFLMGGSTTSTAVRSRNDATETWIKSPATQNYNYLHLATHGTVNEDHPELSCIYLSPDDTNDGVLYSGEIYNLHMNADLVTLSACETGLGKLSKGEGLIGLSRSLTYAGAKNLIVSLWAVADQSTAELMIAFYKQHLHHSDNRLFADDLRKAKLQMIRSETYQDPYYWAPFILLGE